MLTKAVILIFFIFIGILPASAQTVKCFPDTSGWKRINFLYIKITSPNGRVVYLGYEADYQNPSDTNEFVQITARFNSIVSLPAKKTEETPYIQVANNYLENELNSKLKESENKSDPIRYLHWKTKFDSQVGDTIQDGPLEGWLLGQAGECIDGVVKDIFVRDVSEPDKYNPENFVVVGRQYSLNGASHILRADQDNLIERKEK